MHTGAQLNCKSILLFCCAGSCTLPPTSPALSSKAGCVALNSQPLTATGDLLCADKSIATFTAAACNYTGVDVYSVPCIPDCRSTASWWWLS
jgi:hypothetical protein